jgi:putative PIN family toxin of toxin-antitoxin system
MSEGPPRVVFDCVIFAQALINDSGPAGQCLEHARSGNIWLVLSEYVITEIRELPSKLATRLLVTTDRVEAFLREVVALAELIGDVPEVFQHPVDADDSHYVNLALAAGATLITSRDHHLLALMDQSQPVGRAFREQFPQLDIVRPEELIRRLRPA